MRSIIRAGGIFTGEEEINEPSYVVMEDGLIKDIGRIKDKKELPSGEVIDLSDSFIMPGLIDCHVHLFMEGIYDMPERGRRWKESKEITLLRGFKNLERTLRAGVTTVRDLTCPAGMSAVLNEAIQKKMTPAPSLVRCGQAISITGGHFYYSGNYQVDGVDEIRKAVRTLCRGKAGVIKFMLTGCVNFVEQNAGVVEFLEEEIKAGIEEAHRLNRKAAVHVNGNEGVRLALEAGADTIEHGALLDESALEFLTARDDFYWVPTLIPFQRMYDYGCDFDYPIFEPEKVMRVYRDHYEMVKKGFQAGVKVAAGTDGGSLGVEHGDILGEMLLLHKYSGLSRSEALKSATIWAAEALGLENSIGTLAVGKKTDIIGMKHSPLKDLNNLYNVDFICHGTDMYFN